MEINEKIEDGLLGVNPFIGEFFNSIEKFQINLNDNFPTNYFIRFHYLTQPYTAKLRTSYCDDGLKNINIIPLPSSLVIEWFTKIRENMIKSLLKKLLPDSTIELLSTSFSKKNSVFSSKQKRNLNTLY